MILHDLLPDVSLAEKKFTPAIQVSAQYDVPDLTEDVRSKLLTPPFSLPPKYFYDHHGSTLFDQICNTPEYYPTRTEAKLLGRYCLHIMDTLDVHHIIELGSGTSRKTRHLFDACQILNQAPKYWPFDVCEPMLLQTARELQQGYDWLTIQPLAGDYSAGFRHLPKPDGHSLYVFLGSSIGNFTEPEAVSFLTDLYQHMKAGDSLLLGIDRVKDTQVLEAAYNDKQGLTADFNLNLLSVLNNELAADFELANFSHQAIFNEQDSQIEMYLEAGCDQKINFKQIDEVMKIEHGEKILTEISRKYTLEGIECLLAQAEMEIVDHFEPADEYFSLILAQCR